MGQMMYFGGSTNRRQYSIIRDCKVERQLDEMPFDYYRGACNSFMEPTPKVLLCFNFRESIGYESPLGYGSECHR